MDVTVPLWRDGRNGNIQFLSSFKRLQKEDPDLYGLIQQREGFETQDAGYQYKVGCSKFGLWLSRRKMDSKISIPDMKVLQKMNKIMTNYYRYKQSSTNH